MTDNFISKPLDYVKVVQSVFLMESICHSGSRCDWNQISFPDHSLCYIDEIVFVIVLSNIPS
jgi:hypothetical protein